ncbi:uncharacterized protein LOC117581364 [Drosophila guanche]|uniref:uncharacterized protein LOC117581364 n=1 Tax=Drosophila guanche TaxID=7266 RepID=UPI001471F512|nr:uncharacterized protein LOC117581364 [Drosophila guanche]
MSNRLRHRRDTQHSGVTVQTPEPKVHYWPFWRIVYWLVVFVVVLSLCLVLYFTLKSDRGRCKSYDVRCD